MNYRHGFHAGNFGDVLKHAILCLLLRRLVAKPSPFSVLDTHAGRGEYDLTGDEAQRTGEFRHGILRLLERDDAPLSLLPYLEAVRLRNPTGELRRYPGSPRLIRAALRPGDRLNLLELHEAEMALLRRAFGGDTQVSFHDGDGYQALKALLPPRPARGLVLIDPPFEQKDEFAVLLKAVGRGVRRWPTGQFAIWYPVKDRPPVEAFLNELRQIAGDKPPLIAELMVQADTDARALNGTGMALLNPPFGLDAELRELLPYLAHHLGRNNDAGWSVTPQA